MEETGCEVIRGAQTTPAVKGKVKARVKSENGSLQTEIRPKNCLSASWNIFSHSDIHVNSYGFWVFRKKS